MINGQEVYLMELIANRILELAERYEDTLFEIEEDVDKYENQVKEHLRKLGFIKKQE